MSIIGPRKQVRDMEQPVTIRGRGGRHIRGRIGKLDPGPDDDITGRVPDYTAFNLSHASRDISPSKPRLR